MKDLIFRKNNSELDKILADIDITINNAFDLVPVMLWISDAGAKCIFLNKTWYDYTGQNPESGLVGGWTDAIHPDDLPDYNNIYRKALEQNQPFSIEYRIANSQQQYRWFVNSGRPQYDALGNYKGYIGIITDIHDRKLMENALRESENYYKTYAEAMPAMAFISDANGNMIYFNNRWYEFTELNETAQGWGWKNTPVIHPDDLQQTLDTWSYSLRTGVPFEIENRMRRHDGEYLWFLAKALPLRNNNGDIDIWVGTCTEIHASKLAEIKLKKELQERRELEKKLKNERELFETIFHSIPVMLSIWDPTISVNLLNKAFTDITGWTPEDYTKTSIMELAYPDHEYRNQVADYMASLTPGFKDIKMVTKDGQTLDTIWANIRISDGRFVGIGMDISARKKFEHELSKLSRELHTVVENITDGVVVFQPDGKEISVNKAARDILEYLLQGKARLEFDDFCLYDTNGQILDRDQWPQYRAIRGDYFVKEEYLTYNKSNQKKVYLEYSGIPIMEDGKLVMAIVTFQDISLRKNVHIDLLNSNKTLKSKNEELEKINNLHENLLYIIAHDLRNPIGNMYLIIDVIKGVADESERNRLMEMLRQMVKRQENIVNGLVELLEVQSPEKATPAQVNISQVVKENIREHEVVLRECGARVMIECPEDLVLSYIPSFVDSIMKNLINNAIKYRREKVPLELKIIAEVQREFMVVSVKDNGIGIDLNRYSKNLYQPFKRFTRQSEGTGMGLYLIKNLIEKNGGAIEVESIVGQGTTFRCYFKQFSS